MIMQSANDTRQLHASIKRSKTHLFDLRVTPSWIEAEHARFCGSEDGPSAGLKQSGHNGHNFEAAFKMNFCDVNLPSELKSFRFYCRNFHQIAKVVDCLSSPVGWLLQEESSKTIWEEQ
jgi:hypothetical protein